MGMFRGKSKTRDEYRIVCANDNHRYHAWMVADERRGRELIEKNKAEDLYDNPQDFSKQGCLPHHLEKRTVTKWETLE